MSLIVNNLTKKYGEKTVLDHLSFRMDQPGVYALLGTNGAGKTTAIRMILGMLAKNEGEALWNGAPLDTATCNVGYLAEERGLYPKYGLEDQLIYFASLRGVSRADAKARIRRWAERLEVEEYIYTQNKAAPVNPANNSRFGARAKVKTQKPKLADQLSKGNQQKIQLMAALISEPELLILDEPLSGLDPVNTDLFKSIIRDEINQGKYLIMSSHQMPTVEEFCTDITILNRSKTILQGNLNEIKKSYGRVNLYIKTEQNIMRYIAGSGAGLVSKKEFEYNLRVIDEQQANNLLGTLIQNGITVITFDLREPSLHEIFVEKVGDANEAE